MQRVASGIRLKDCKVLTASLSTVFLVLACGAVAIAAAHALHAQLEILRRFLIPPAMIAGLILAAPTLLPRWQGSRYARKLKQREGRLDNHRHLVEVFI
jgi:hypothetical protein